MKKEQNAEKTKVRKLARTKEKVSQWTTNPLNEKVLDPHFNHFCKTCVSIGIFSMSHSWLMWSKHPLMSPSRIH